MTDKQLRILVTGAGRGIGRSIVDQLKQDPLKHKIAVTARTESELISAVAGASGESLIIPADATDQNTPQSVVEMVVKKWGGIDVIFLNAGEAQVLPIEQTSDEIWNHILNLNVTAPMRFLRAATPTMKAQGFGRVIVIASIAGLMGEGFVSAYTASKHAVIGLVRSAAVELNKYGITINAICPGYVDTPMLEKGLAVSAARTGKSVSELKEILAQKQPGNRLLTASEVATSALEYIQSQDNGQALWLDAETRKIF